jgi:hypothetical protein
MLGDTEAAKMGPFLKACKKHQCEAATCDNKQDLVATIAVEIVVFL